MPRNRQYPPNPKGRSKEQLFDAETSGTSTDSPDDKKLRGNKQKGERVEAPSAELLPQATHDWGKIGVYITLSLAAVAAVYNYADLASLARNTADDVKDLKRKSDDLLKSSLEASARIGVLERKEIAPPAAPSSGTAPRVNRP